MRLVTLAVSRSARLPPCRRRLPSRCGAWRGLADYTDTLLLGDAWKRPGPSARDRNLVTIAALIPLNKPPQLSCNLPFGLPGQCSSIVAHRASVSTSRSIRSANHMHAAL